MEKTFEELTTAEIAALTPSQQEYYAQVCDYPLEQIIAEVENCKTILKNIQS